jgi:hypothetical protein
LITGLPRRHETDYERIAVIVPVDVARDLERASTGRMVVPMPGRRVLLDVHPRCIADPQDVEALIRTAYDCALA